MTSNLEYEKYINVSKLLRKV